MKKIPLLLCFIVLQWNLHAQNLSKTGVLTMNIRSSGAITQDGQVKGYYLFYKVDKQDRKNYNYLLSVFDENLREINSITITRPKTFTLIEGAFNGEVFGFLFYDSKARSVEVISYDRTLKQAGSIVKPVGNKLLLASFQNIVVGNEATQAFLVPVANKGFLYYGLKAGKKMHYEMTFFDNKMKSLWTEKANDKTPLPVELASDAFQSSEYVGTLLTTKKYSQSSNTETTLIVQETSTGKTLFRAPMKTDQYTVSFSDVYFDQEKQNITVFGEYFDKKDAEMSDRSLGFITLVYDMTGKLTTTKTNSWLNEISKAAPVNERGKFDGNNTNILFHNIVRTADGKVFVIGEQYKKAASAVGIVSNVASALLGGGPTTSTVQINVYNMVIFEFNPDYTLKKVHVFEKDKNVMQLPSGIGWNSARLLSYYTKAVGGFDYAFTQNAKDKSAFYVSYINYDREKGEKSKNVLGTIVYTPEKVFTVDKLPLDRKSSAFYVYKAKEGYVLVTEYFKKEKRLDSRLEKVNY